MGRLRFRHVFLGILLALFGSMTNSAQAQDPPIETAVVQQQPADLSSPRATVQSFYEAMTQVQAGDDSQLAAALATLYLNDIPEAQRATAGRTLAERLYAVLDSITWSLEAVPADREGRRVAVTLGQDKQVTVVLRHNSDGAWRFSYSETLSSLDEMHAQVVEPAVDEEAAQEYVEGLESPRAAVRHLLTGVNNWKSGGLNNALQALDLSDYERDVRDAKGQEAAVLLKRVLDRYKRIELNEIPNSPESEPYTLLADAAGSIVVAPVVDEESGLKAWRVTSDSVESARALWDVYRDHSIVVGVEDNTPTVFSLAVRDYVGDSFPFLLQRAFILENWQWLGLFVVIFAGMALSRFIAWLMVLTIRRWFRSEHLELDKKLEHDFVKPVRIALMAWVWLLGLTILGLPANVLYYLAEGAKVVSAAAGLWAAYRLVDIIFDFVTHRATRTPSKYDDILVALVGRSLKVFVIAVGFIIILSIFGWDYKSVLAGLGLGGLAFALAAKDTVSNFFGSLTVVLDRPFSIGDWVNIDGIEGTVEEVGIRSTRIRTFYNSLISVPNAKLIDTAIDNYGARRYRRIKTILAVTYDTPPEKIEAFCEGIREIIRQHPYTRKDFYHVYFNDYGAASLDILLYCFVETPDWSTELRERERLLLDILRLAKQLHIEFAFPTQTVYLRNDQAPTYEPTDNGSRRHNFDEGRQTAAGVLQQSYGDTSRRPPPVTFTHPDGIESDLP